MNRLLNIQEFGDGSASECLMLVHGLFGSGRNWRTLARKFARHRFVVTVDMRNHGHSFHDGSHSYQDMADDLARVISQIEKPMHLLGHSMGGKAAMIYALQNPSALQSLIVADIAPVTYEHTQLSLVRAMQALDLRKVNTRSDANDMLKRDIPDPQVRAFLIQSLAFESDGPRWLLNLDALARSMDKIIGFPDSGGKYFAPTLFLSGGASDYVLESHKPKIASLFPNAVFDQISHVGHWLHAEDPEGFVEKTQSFLYSLSPMSQK